MYQLGMMISTVLARGVGSVDVLAGVDDIHRFIKVF